MATNHSPLKRILPLVLALMIDNMSIGAVFPIITTIFQRFPAIFFSHPISGQSISNFMGLAYLLMPLGMFFGATFLGDISDIWGRRKAMIIAITGIGIGFLMMAFSIIVGSVWVFLFGRLVTGLMAGSQSIAQAAVIDMSTPATKAMNMSLVSFAVTAGNTLGPLISGVFSSVSSLGFPLPFIIIGLGGFIAAIWIAISFRDHRPPVKGAKIDWLRSVTALIEGISHPNVRMMIFVAFFYQVGIALFFQVVLVKLQEQLSYNTLWQGIYLSAYGVICLIGFSYVAKLILRRIVIEKGAAIFIGLNGLFVAILSYATDESVIWGTGLVAGIFNALGYTSLLTSFSNTEGEGHQGWVMGIALSAIALAFLVGGAMMSLLDILGPNNLLLIGGLIMFVSSLLMRVYCRLRKGVL